MINYAGLFESCTAQAFTLPQHARWQCRSAILGVTTSA